MATKSKVNLTLVLALIATFVASEYTQAADYECLKTVDYNNIFVDADFSSCAVAEQQLKKSLEGVLIRSRVKPYISQRPPLLIVEEEGKPDSFLIHELVKNKKRFLYAYVFCSAYKSSYVYKADVRFGVVDEDRNVLLFAQPDHFVVGIQDIDGIDTGFRKIVENAIADYLSANMKR